MEIYQVFSNNGAPPDSLVFVWLSAGSHEVFNQKDHPILNSYASLRSSLVGVSHLSVDVGSLILSGGHISATYYPDSSFEYRLHNKEPFIPAIKKPLFGQQARWKIPPNTKDIPALDTMLYTPQLLNVQATGTIAGSDQRMTSTSTLTLQWNADPLSNDTVRVSFIYDTRHPLNAHGNYPPKRISYIAFAPDQGHCIVPASVIGLVPIGQFFEIRVQRDIHTFIPIQGQYIYVSRHIYANKRYSIVQ